MHRSWSLKTKTWSKLVVVVQGLGRSAEGAVCHERALALREARLDASDPALASTLIYLAVR